MIGKVSQLKEMVMTASEAREMAVAKQDKELQSLFEMIYFKAASGGTYLDIDHSDQATLEIVERLKTRLESLGYRVTLIYNGHGGPLGSAVISWANE